MLALWWEYSPICKKVLEQQFTLEVRPVYEGMWICLKRTIWRTETIKPAVFSSFSERNSSLTLCWSSELKLMWPVSVLLLKHAAMLSLLSAPSFTAQMVRQTSCFHTVSSLFLCDSRLLLNILTLSLFIWALQGSSCFSLFFRNNSNCLLLECLGVIQSKMKSHIRPLSPTDWL